MFLSIVIILLIIYNLCRAIHQFHHTYSAADAADIIVSLVLAECFAMMLSPKISFQITGLLIGTIAQTYQLIDNKFITE